MFARTSRILVLMVVAALLANAQAPVCHAWSLLHPFSSDAKPQPKPPAAKPVKKPPSAWKKFTTGTKNFCGKVGETIGLKKAPPPKPQYAYPKVRQPEKASSSWFGSLFRPKEPPAPKSPSAFIGGPRPKLEPDD